MKVHYTGRKAEINDAEKAKAQRKFEKIHRVLGAAANHEAHVVLSRERNRFEAEVTLRALHHTLVVSGQNAQPFTALTAALSKLEKQVVKNKHKLVSARRPQRQRGEGPVLADAAPPAAETAPEDEGGEPRIIRSNGVQPKPLTVEGAAIRLEELNRDQVTFRDAESGRMCVLLRRRDGALELVEA